MAICDGAKAPLNIIHEIRVVSIGFEKSKGTFVRGKMAIIFSVDLNKPDQHFIKTNKITKEYLQIRGRDCYWRSLVG